MSDPVGAFFEATEVDLALMNESGGIRRCLMGTLDFDLTRQIQQAGQEDMLLIQTGQKFFRRHTILTPPDRLQGGLLFSFAAVLHPGGFFRRDPCGPQLLHGWDDLFQTGWVAGNIGLDDLPEQMGINLFQIR